MNLRVPIVVLLACSLLMPLTSHGDITTEFNTSDGFITGDFNPVTLTSTTTPGFDATFSLGQQQQMFDGGSYVNGPAGYLFINGTFNGVSGDGVNDDLGLIDFSGPGAGNVSFFAANRGNGAGVTVNVFGLDDTTLLSTFVVTQSVLNPSATQTVLSETLLGGAIGSIQFDLPGPAANAPYAAAIDTFSASASAIPEPGVTGICILGLLSGAMRRRGRKS